MAELEAVIEKRLIEQLCTGESQWTYRPDIRTEEQLWDNFKYILEQNNKAKLNDEPLSDSEFAKIKNDLSHASFYDAAKWLVGENGKVYVHVRRGNDKQKLLILRPYQIHAIRAMRNASKKGISGFIWHTTGSGKTMTSYKATRNLLMDIPSIEKTIFLIDRKDLHLRHQESHILHDDENPLLFGAHEIQHSC